MYLAKKYFGTNAVYKLKISDNSPSVEVNLFNIFKHKGTKEHLNSAKNRKMLSSFLEYSPDNNIKFRNFLKEEFKVDVFNDTSNDISSLVV